jgi:rod shape-determining protein MreC
METFLNRHRNLTVLVLVIAAQLLLLAFQVRSDNDMRLIRVWAVTAVTPLARFLEGMRSSTVGFLGNYIVLTDVREENKRLRQELGRLKLENQFLHTELSTAERARALTAFQSRTPSRTIAARIIGTGTGTNSKVVFVDRGSVSGVERGMAVTTPDGIVGKVLAVYPTASQVLLITDSSFAAGVISQKNRVHGTLKGQGHGTVVVDYVQNEEKVEVGEWFYTSGDDRVFPKGLPAGEAKVVRVGKTFKEILLVPSGLNNGLEEVLIVLEGIHQQIPDVQVTANTPIHVLTPPPDAASEQAQAAEGKSQVLSTDADRLRDRYKRIGEAQGHIFGEGAPGTRPPNFNIEPAPAAKPAAPPATGPAQPAAGPSPQAAPGKPGQTPLPRPVQ